MAIAFLVLVITIAVSIHWPVPELYFFPLPPPALAEQRCWRERDCKEVSCLLFYTMIVASGARSHGYIMQTAYNTLLKSLSFQSLGSNKKWGGGKSGDFCGQYVLFLTPSPFSLTKKLERDLKKVNCLLLCTSRVIQLWWQQEKVRQRRDFLQKLLDPHRVKRLERGFQESILCCLHSMPAILSSSYGTIALLLMCTRL